MSNIQPGYPMSNIQPGYPMSNIQPGYPMSNIQPAQGHNTTTVVMPVRCANSALNSILFERLAFLNAKFRDFKIG